MSETWLNKLKLDHDIFQENIKVAKSINKIMNKKNWKLNIITLTRDPIARDISGIFQTWQHIFDVDDITEISKEDILNYLLRGDFSYPENWFKTEFSEYTSLNILDEKFNSTKGYTIYETEKAAILVMQLEQLNLIYNDAMNHFIGKDEYSLNQENQTSSKASSKLNKEVKSAFTLSSSKLEKVYDSDYIKTFYTKAQINSMVKKWSKKRN